MKRRSGEVKPSSEKEPGLRLPKLRQLEPIPVAARGERWIALKDPAGWVEAPFEIPPDFAFLLQFLDGKHSLRDIQKAYADATGEFLFLSNIEKLVTQLDEAYLLDTPRFQEYRKGIIRAFRAAPARRPAGKGYPRDPKRLAGLLDRLLEEAPPVGKLPGRLAGIVAPHLEIETAGPAYAAAYAPLAVEGEADVAIVLGTCHAGLASGFALTRKEYETPLGRLPIDTELVDAVVEAVPTALEEDHAHRAECTIEYQAVFLSHLFGKRRRPFRILPVLCGFGAGDAKAPEQKRIILQFLGALEAAVARSGKRAVWIASADLSHVGPRFGDARGMSPAALAKVAEVDRQVMEPALAGDADEFLARILRVQEGHRICGFPVLYCLARLAPRAKGRLVDYGQGAADDMGSFITYASAVYTQGTEKPGC